MSVQLTITFDNLLELAEQLKPEEKQSLIEHLQQETKPRRLSKEEFKDLLHSMIIDLPLAQPFSLRREDWYDDDGR